MSKEVKTLVGLAAAEQLNKKPQSQLRLDQTVILKAVSAAPFPTYSKGIIP